MISCGIDFGTSNSSIAIASAGDIELVSVENNNVTIPSAVFFPAGGYNPIYGRAAVKMFFERQNGRFMRSLKRVLGTPLMTQGTIVNGKPFKFDRIISSFLENLMQKANASVNGEIESVVIGRPVHFVDNDETADRRAQAELKDIALRIGYKNIDFQFEPIAAAFAHEAKIKGEKLAIVADLGGGTSDFTVIRLSDKYITRTDRSSDILANTGVRLGGNDFDKELSLATIMPELGYLSTYGEKNLEVPLKYYHDLAEWSKVNFLYTPKVLSKVKELLHQSHDKKRFGRLLKLLEQETGHTLLTAAEDAKIALTSQTMHPARFEFLESDFVIPISQQQFESSIRNGSEQIFNAATDCLQKAGVKQEDIDLVILTGGSTEIPFIQIGFKELFPQATFADENKLSSVGLGLAYDSQRKFG